MVLGAAFEHKANFGDPSVASDVLLLAMLTAAHNVAGALLREMELEEKRVHGPMRSFRNGQKANFWCTQGSVLPAIVLHTSLNGWAGILGIVPTASTARPYELVTGLLVLVAAAVLIRKDPTPSPLHARSST